MDDWFLDQKLSVVPCSMHEEHASEACLQVNSTDSKISFFLYSLSISCCALLPVLQFSGASAYNMCIISLDSAKIYNEPPITVLPIKSLVLILC